MNSNFESRGSSMRSEISPATNITTSGRMTASVRINHCLRPARRAVGCVGSGGKGSVDGCWVDGIDYVSLLRGPSGRPSWWTSWARCQGLLSLHK